jgi:energy-coupling factor transport system ATP-binding protein
MIHIEGLRHRILKIPTLDIHSGTTTFIGPNGAGKSTLLRLCAGVEMPQAGSILIEGAEPRKTEIGWVDENPERTLLFERVKDEIASTLRFREVSCPEIEAQVHTLIEHLGISSLLDRSTWNLSAGEKVLVALGAALAGAPLILILDEVDSHLDSITREKLCGILQRRDTRYILIATQHMEVAATADQVIYLEKGAVLHQGPPEEVFSSLEDTCFYPQSWRNLA